MMKLLITALLFPAFLFSGCADYCEEPDHAPHPCDNLACASCEECARVEIFRTANPEDGLQNEVYLFRLADGKLLGAMNDDEIKAPLLAGQAVCLTARFGGICGAPPLPRNIMLMTEAGAEPKILTCLETCEGPIIAPEAPETDCTPLARGKRPAHSEVGGLHIAGVPRIRRDCIEIPVAYSGCDARTDDFVLYWDGAAAESEPPQVQLRLTDKYADESICEMLIQETLRFDLSELKEIKGKTVVVKINGGEHSVVYKN